MGEHHLHNMLSERALAMNLRPYQAEALDVLTRKHAEGKDRFHVVAPPGSGKTIIGIAFLQRLGVKSVILSPNAAIQAQWIDKYGRATADLVDTLGEVWGNDVRHLIGHDPAQPTPILSLTYQRIAVRDAMDGSMHENVEHLVDILRRQDYRLLILDECHHLLAFWAEVLKEVLALHPMLVLGLTATPPVDRAAREQSLYLDLVGPVDYQIPLPAVVKDGNLAPFQDLVCLVHPDPQELAFIRARHQEFHALFEDLNSAQTDVTPLHLYVQDVLDSCAFLGRQYDEWRSFQKHNTSVAIALGRYARQYGIPLPAHVSMLDEMEEALTLDDVSAILQGYLDDVCGDAHAPEVTARIDRVTRALRQLGYEKRGGGFVRRRSAIDRVLALSHAKHGMLRRILTQEIQNLGDHVRALVLTDFETAQAGGMKALEGILDPEAGGAVAAMRTITSDPDTDVLDPVMLTGSSVLCDDDLAQRFCADMRAIAAVRQWEIRLETVFIGEGEYAPGDLAGASDATRGMFEIRGSGSDWNTRTYVLMITELFDRGVTRCLIGTRGLLGEGWDSAAVNVLIDMTAVASYVSVNQMHGRSLRLDPSRPEKVANNWDIVAVLPEFERGFADWDRFLRKHEHFYGLSDDGELERGIGHVHPLLTHLRPDELTGAIDRINEDMLARSARRDAVLRAWRIGLEYRGVELPCLEYLPDADTPERLPATARSAAKLEQVVEEFHMQSRRLGGIAALLPALSAAAVSVAANAFAPALTAAAGLSTFGLLTAGLLWYRARRLNRIVTDEQHISRAEHVLSLATVVRDSIVALREDARDTVPPIRSSTRDDGGLRIWIESDLEDENTCFTSSMNELFRPLQDQRYILQTYRLVHGRRIGELLRKREPADAFVEAGIVPVPSDFARKRKRADVFHRFWEEHMGKADLLYTRKGEGAKLLETQLRTRFMQGRRFVKVLWK